LFLLAIERADVCLMMIDANEGVTDQDAKIAGEAHEAGKGIIIVVKSNVLIILNFSIDSDTLLFLLIPAVSISTYFPYSFSYSVSIAIEKFSIMRTLLAIERADVCLMMIDANEGVTDQDKIFI